MPDDESLPYEWHQRFFQYVLAHWQDWKLHVEEFKEPGPNEMVDAIEGRLSDPAYPATKKWTYLLCLPDGLAADGQSAKCIVMREIASSSHPVAEAAKQIVHRSWA